MGTRGKGVLQENPYPPTERESAKAVDGDMADFGFHGDEHVREGDSQSKNDILEQGNAENRFTDSSLEPPRSGSRKRGAK